MILRKNESGPPTVLLVGDNANSLADAVQCTWAEIGFDGDVAAAQADAEPEDELVP